MRLHLVGRATCLFRAWLKLLHTFSIGSCLLPLSRVLGTLTILRRKHLRLCHLARQHRHLHPMTNRPHLVWCKILLPLCRHLPSPLRLRSPVRQHRLRPMASHPHLARCKILLSLRRPRHTTWRLPFPCLAPPECISVSYHVNGMCAALWPPHDIGSLPGAIPLRPLPPEVFGFIRLTLLWNFSISIQVAECFSSTFMIVGFTYGYAV